MNRTLNKILSLSLSAALLLNCNTSLFASDTISAARGIELCNEIMSEAQKQDSGVSWQTITLTGGLSATVIGAVLTMLYTFEAAPVKSSINASLKRLTPAVKELSERQYNVSKAVSKSFTTLSKSAESTMAMNEYMNGIYALNGQQLSVDKVVVEESDIFAWMNNKKVNNYAELRANLIAADKHFDRVLELERTALKLGDRPLFANNPTFTKYHADIKNIIQSESGILSDATRLKNFSKVKTAGIWLIVLGVVTIGAVIAFEKTQGTSMTDRAAYKSDPKYLLRVDEAALDPVKKQQRAALLEALTSADRDLKVKQALIDGFVAKAQELRQQNQENELLQKSLIGLEEYKGRAEGLFPVGAS